MQLVADRFVAMERTEQSEIHAIDLATGERAILTIVDAGSRSEQTRWTVRCDELHRLRHPSIAVLLDFGLLGESHRFEAWRCGATWQGSSTVSREVQRRARDFFQASSLTISAEAMQSVRAGTTGALFLPDAGTGYRVDAPEPTPRLPLDARGLALVPRPAASALAEMFRVPCANRPHVAAVWGPPESGKACVVSDLARSARQQGFIPMSSRLIGTMPDDLVRGRNLFVIHEGHDAEGWSRFLQVAASSPGPHVLLFVGLEERSGIDGLALDRVAIDLLVASLRPTVASDDESVARVVRKAAERARGLPGRFARTLWPASAIVVDAERPRRGGVVRVAERVARYGQDDRETPWPAPAELTAFRRRTDSARALLRAGRHAPGIRLLRQTIGGFARRGSWADAAEGAVTLGAALLQRGRVSDAQAVLDEAQRHAARTGNRDVLIDVAILGGHAWIDLARLDEGERLLGAAVSAARAAGDAKRSALAAIAMARCLFWRGQYADARVALGQPPDDATSAVALRHACMEARLAVGRRDFQRAMSIVATARQHHLQSVDAAGAAAIAAAAAFVHLAIGDLESVERDARDAVSAARLAHDPLRSLKARLLFAESERQRGRVASSQSQLLRMSRSADALPPIVRARCDLVSSLAAGADVRDALRRAVSSTGLAALNLFVAHERGDRPSAVSGDFSDLGEVVAILRACQTAGDEAAVLRDVCRRVRDQLHAGAAGFFACLDGRVDAIAADGVRLDGDIATRAVTTGIAIAPHRHGERTEAAAPVQYGGSLIGALCARWTVGSTYSLSRATSVLTMAATAAAPVLSAVLEQRRRPPVAVLDGLIGVTPAMHELRRTIERAAAAPFAVLIEGESGSGKELVARAIHRLGQRRDRPFSTLNCAALPDDLIEAELFGHARGSFTGAVSDRPGVFEEAHGGTLFLDEIGELSLRAQAKVLRVIQEGELRRIGENTSRRVDVRIVSATNRSLRQEVEAGRFRLDLQYRLDVVRIAVPPLRERSDDIALLVAHVWREATERVGSRAALSAGAVAALSRYDWPGNVRELQNVLAALAVRSPKRGVVPATALPAAFGNEREHDARRLDAARRVFEERFVRAALVRSGGRRALAAEELGVSRQGLTKLMARLGIRSSQER